MVRLTLLFFTSAAVGVALAGLATSKRLPEDDIHTLSYKVLVVVMTSYKLLFILGDWLLDCCWTAGVTTAAAASAVVEADDDETAAVAGLFAGLLIRRLASSRENKTLGTEDDSLIPPSVLLIEVTVLLLLDESSTVKSQCSKKWGKQSVYYTPPYKEVAIQCFW